MGHYSKQLQARAQGEQGETLEGVIVTEDLTLIVHRGGKRLELQISPAEALDLAATLHRLGEQGGKARAVQPLYAVRESHVEGIAGLGPNAYAVTISSEMPVPYADRVHILEHSPDAIVLRAPELPLLVGHDGRRLVGVVRGLRLHERKLHGIAFFDSTPFAQEIRQRVDSGELRGVSVAFSEHRWEPIEAGARVTRWSPVEVSICNGKTGSNPECEIVPLRDRYRGD
jgi:prohead serine protease